MTTKVGIMSMQRIRNYGSSLQALGLRRLVENAGEDAVVSFLDYEPGPILEGRGAAAAQTPIGRTLVKVLQYNRTDARVAQRLRFFNHKRMYERRNFPLVGIPAGTNRDLSVDLQILGSDEVFNCVQANTRVGYSRGLFGHDSAARRVVTYAASFGNTTLEKIDRAGIAQSISADLAALSDISVRDENSAIIVRKMTGREPEIHIDPALAYDFMRLESRIPIGRIIADKYVVAYGYSGRLTVDEGRALKEFARGRDAVVVCLGGVQPGCDRFLDADVMELLALFRDAEAVVTDTFHGTIFAMINRRPFASIIRSSVGAGYGNEQKLGFLLDSFGLSAQRATDSGSISRCLGNDIDFGSVADIVAHERARTEDYLKRVITGSTG